MKALFFGLVSLVAVSVSDPARAEILYTLTNFANVYNQSAPGVVTPTHAVFSFHGTVTPGLYESSSLLLPNGALVASGMFFGEQLADAASRDAKYPLGTYHFEVTEAGSGTTFSTAIDIPTGLFPLSIPELSASSFNALQGMNVASGLNLTFNAMVAAPSALFSGVLLQAREVGGGGGVFWSPLSSGATSFLIPANSLMAGREYELWLSFVSGTSVKDGNTQNSVQFSDGTFIRFSTASAGAVPEPSSWVLLILGFGLTGSLMRRRGMMLCCAPEPAPHPLSPPDLDHSSSNSVI